MTHPLQPTSIPAILSRKLLTTACAMLFVAGAAIAQDPERFVVGGTNSDIPDVTLDSVRVVAASDDAVLIAVHGEPSDPTQTPRRIQVFSRVGKRMLHELRGLIGPVQAMTFSPGGRLLIASGSQPWGETLVWEVRSGRLLHRLNSGGPSIALTGRGAQVAVADTEQMRVITYDLRTGAEVRRTDRFRFPVSLAPDARIVASRSSTEDPRLWLRDLPSSRERETISEAVTPPPANAIAVTPDARTLVTSDGSSAIVVMDLITGLVVQRITTHEKKISAIDVSADGQFILSAGFDRKLCLHELATGKVIQTSTPHRGPITIATWDKTGNWIVSGSVDRTVHLSNIGRALQLQSRPESLTASETKTLYESLASSDPQLAYRSLMQSRRASETVLPTLRTSLFEMLVPAQNERIRQLIDDLDDSSDVVRDRATDELRKLRKLAQPLLIRTLKTTASAEVRYRLRRVLFGSGNVPRFSPSDLRRFRRIAQLCEQVGDEDSIAMLEMLIEHLTDAEIVREAKDSLQRIGER